LEMPQALSLATPVFSPFVVVPGAGTRSDQLLLQGRAVLAISPVSTDFADGATSTNNILTLGAVESPYVEPFDGLDHLQILKSDGCPDVALAVGAFRSSVNGVSRQLQLITFGEDYYLTHEIATSFSVTTFGLAAVADGRVFIGMVGKDSHGDVFGLIQVASCGMVSIIGTWPTTFDWRTPDAPALLDLGPSVPKTDGVKLLGRTEKTSDVSGERMTFTNYDGYILRTWAVSLETVDAGQAIPSLEAVMIHEDRKDLAYAN